MFNRLLNPLNWLYGGITDIRNALYDRRIISVLRPSIYTISVGNITVGGTGKTPHVDYLVRLLKPSGPLATLSRGYGRRTKGFRLATDADTADTIGDEPLLLYRKHGKNQRADQARVLISVGEKRAEAIPELLKIRPDLQMIILDDAFQHRPVQAHLNLMLTDFNRLFYDDQPFPGGRLRERRHGARRADAILVTKCPNGLSRAEQQAIQNRIRVYGRVDVPVFFTGFRDGNPINFATPSIRKSLKSVVLVSGIARPETLETYVKSHFSLVRHWRFADHYRYTAADLKRILDELPAGETVLTTEKDFVKLAPLLAETRTDASRFAYLPIDVQFLEDEEQFREIIQKSQPQRV